MSKCKDAAKQVETALAPFMKTTVKAANTIHHAVKKMNLEDEITDSTLKNYYKTEKQKKFDILNNYKTKISQYPDKLKKLQIENNKFAMFGGPTSTPDDIKAKLKIYKSNLEKNFTNVADNIESTSLAQHKNYIKDIKTMILYYNSQEEYAKRMKNMLDIKNTEHIRLEDKLEKLLKKNLTDNRKAVYEDYEIESLSATRKVLYYIYYIVFLLYLIFGNFFTDKKYRSVAVWMVMILYLTVPVFIKYICNGIIYLYREFLYIKDNKLPKNVYTGL